MSALRDFQTSSFDCFGTSRTKISQRSDSITSRSRRVVTHPDILYYATREILVECCRLARNKSIYTRAYRRDFIATIVTNKSCFIAPFRENVYFPPQYLNMKTIPATFKDEYREGNGKTVFDETESLAYKYRI